jgi:hypothetical protein
MNSSLTKGKVAYPHNDYVADISSDWPQAPLFSLEPVPSPPHIGVEDGKVTPIHHANTQTSPQVRTHPKPPTAAPPDRCTPSSQSIVTTTSSPTSFTIPFQPTHQSRTPLIPQESRKSILSTLNDIPSQARVPDSPRSPSSLVHTNPSSEPIDVPLVTNHGREHRTLRRPGLQSTVTPNLLPRPEERKPLATQGQANGTAYIGGMPKPSAKITSIQLEQMAPKSQRLSIRLMPGSLVPVDVDISSWVIVSPVEVPKTSWYKRLFTRIRHS